MLFRQICVRYPGIGWDTQIAQEEHHLWKAALKQLLEIKNITVPRFALEGITDYSDITAVLFSDGSDVSSACKIYVRYPVGEGRYVARYLTGATKIGAKGNNSAPRQECTGVLLACRLYDQVCATWKDVTFKQAFLFVDSNCALGGVLGRTQAQTLFFSTRNYESKLLIDRHKIIVRKIPSKFQLADGTTKMCLDVNVALDPGWWECDWLAKPISTWPVSEYQFCKSDEAVLVKAIPKLLHRTTETHLQCNNTVVQCSGYLEQGRQGQAYQGQVGQQQGGLIQANQHQVQANTGQVSMHQAEQHQINQEQVNQAMESNTVQGQNITRAVQYQGNQPSAEFLLQLMERFNTFTKVTNCLAYILLFSGNYKTFIDAFEKAKLLLIKTQKFSEDELRSMRSKFMVSQDDQGVFFILPRTFVADGIIRTEKLLLIQKKSKLARLILNECHIHQSSCNYSITNMIKSGFYVIGNRKMLNDISDKYCIMCRRLRKEVALRVIGPSHQFQAYKNTFDNISLCTKIQAN